MTQRLPFQQLLHQGVGEGATSFPGLLHFALEPYLIMVSVKQGSIKYHFWIFGIIHTGIEPRSPGPLANTLTKSKLIYIYIYIYIIVEKMGISIYIRFYNNFPPKNVSNKTSISRMEIIIRQFRKIAYLVYFRTPKEEQVHAQIIKKTLIKIYVSPI